MNTPGKINALPPKISPKPPPPVPVEEEEPQEVYEVPENPAAENYLSFEPQNVSQPPTNSNIQQDNDSQVCLLMYSLIMCCIWSHFDL